MKRKKRLCHIILLSAGFVSAFSFLLGCGAAVDQHVQQLTVAEVGCPFEEIEILDRTMMPEGQRWTARCRGRVYYCHAQEGFSNCTAETGGEGVQTASANPMMNTIGTGQASSHQQCNVNSDCPDGRYCSDGSCHFDCRQNRDCPGGQTCDARNGRCEMSPEDISSSPTTTVTDE